MKDFTGEAIGVTKVGGPFRQNAYNGEPTISFAQRMQEISKRATDIKTKEAKKITEENYHLVHSYIEGLAKSGSDEALLGDVESVYTEKDLKFHKRTLASLLTEDGFKIYKSGMIYPRKVTWKNAK